MRKEPSPLRAKLLLAGWIGAIGARASFRPLVVGGTAVDFYVAEALERTLPEGWMASLDLDVVSVSQTGFSPVTPFIAELEREGFVNEKHRDADGVEHPSRALRHPALPYAIEVLAEPLTGSMSHVVTLDVDEFEVRLIGPEDLVLKYAESGSHFRHQRDWTRALAIVRAQRATMDLDYLRGEAARKRIGPVVAKALAGEALV